MHECRDPAHVHGDPTIERAWGPGVSGWGLGVSGRGDPERACAHGPVRACVRAWAPRANGHEDPVRACVRAWAPRASGHGDPDPVRVCMETKRAWGPGASVRAWAPRASRRGDPVRASVHGPRERAGVGTQCEQACTGPVRACMHGPSACVRACVPCECVRAWIQRARTRACGDPARATSSSSLIPRASKHSGCKKIAKSEIHLLYEPSAGRG